MEIRQSAKQNYARFYEMEVDAVTIFKLEATSLQTAGWAYVEVLDYDEIERLRLAQLDRDPITANCWAFDTQNDETGVDMQNVQIARLSVALGEDDSGRRAIFRTVAGMQGIVSDNALESLYDGTTEEKLIAAAHSSSTL